MKSLQMLSGIAVLAAAFAAGQAGAHGTVEYATKTVNFSDLNIESAAGAKALYLRIEAAAREVCEPSRGLGRLTSAAYEACVQDAVQAGVAQVHRAKTAAAAG